MLFRLTILHLIIALSKVQGQGYAQFDFDCLINGMSYRESVPFAVE